MENQLLECLEVMSAAGDDERSRLSRVARNIGYDELTKPWKALARIAVSKMGPKVAEDAVSSNRPVRRSGRRSARGKRGRDPVEEVIANAEEDNAGYRLCRILLMSNKDSNASESDIGSIRSECEKGLHPVWERLARDAPIFAELSRFPVKEQKEDFVDVNFWSESAKFDPINHREVASWLSIEPPFHLTGGRLVYSDGIERFGCPTGTQTSALVSGAQSNKTATVKNAQMCFILSSHKKTKTLQ